MLSVKKLEIPKKIHHTFIIDSSFTSSCKALRTIKQDESAANKQQINLVAASINKFIGNPYVRLMRLDRPIGKKSA